MGWAPCVVIVLGLCVVALLLPRWFLIYDPGQRVFFLALLVSIPLFPSRPQMRRALCLLCIPLLICLRVQEHYYLRWADGLIRDVTAPFRSVPQRLRGEESRALPLVLSPYLYMCAAHRAFEYYHIANGGMNPNQLLSSSHTVRYRRPPMGRSIYDPDPNELDDKFLQHFNVAILIGADTPQAGPLIKRLSASGFSMAMGNNVTLVLARPPTNGQKRTLGRE